MVQHLQWVSSFHGVSNFPRRVKRRNKAAIKARFDLGSAKFVVRAAFCCNKAGRAGRSGSPWKCNRRLRRPREPRSPKPGVGLVLAFCAPPRSATRQKRSGVDGPQAGASCFIQGTRLQYGISSFWSFSSNECHRSIQLQIFYSNIWRTVLTLFRAVLMLRHFLNVRGLINRNTFTCCKAFFIQRI